MPCPSYPALCALPLTRLVRALPLMPLTRLTPPSCSSPHALHAPCMLLLARRMHPVLLPLARAPGAGKRELT